MTISEARIRRRIFGTRRVQVFRNGEDVFADDDVVKTRWTLLGIRIWCLWSDRHHGEETNREVVEYRFPMVDEVRVWRDD